MVRLYCPDCGTTIDAEPGQEARCPSCGFSAAVPPDMAGQQAPAQTPSYTTRPFGAPAQGYTPPAMPVPQQAGAPHAQGQHPPGQYPQPRTNGMCTASLVMGLVGLCPFLSFVVSILAIVFGVIGKRQANERNERGEGMAIAGIVLGSLELALSLVWMFAMFPFWMGGFVGGAGP